MKIIDAIRSEKRTLSFEVFPPKKETSYEAVLGSALKIASLSPAFISVTYGAGGTTDKYTVELAARVQEECGVPALAHLTCVGTNKEKAAEVLRRMEDAGVENILALRGDLPEELGKSALNDFPHASDLTRFIRENSDLCVGGACYPEGHPESENLAQDIEGLKNKVDAGAEFLTTQMFFDNDELFHFLYLLREAEITVPVLPGIMPITSAKQIRRAKELSGAYLPKRFLTLLDRFGGNPPAMRQAGIAYATEQIIDLYAGGMKHVHVYSMNDVGVAETIMRNLSDILG